MIERPKLIDPLGDGVIRLLANGFVNENPAVDTPIVAELQVPRLHALLVDCRRDIWSETEQATGIIVDPPEHRS